MSFDIRLLKAWRRHRAVSIALMGGYVVVGFFWAVTGLSHNVLLGLLLSCAALVGTILNGAFLAELGNALFPHDRVRLADALERAQAEAAELKRRLELGDEAVRKEKYLREKEAWEQQVLEAKANGTRPPPTPVPLAPPGKDRG